MPNLLVDEFSPVWQQLADVPEDRLAWLRPVLELAQTQYRTILLAIGYAACSTDVVKLFDTPQLSGILHFQTLFFIIVETVQNFVST